MKQRNAHEYVHAYFFLIESEIGLPMQTGKPKMKGLALLPFGSDGVGVNKNGVIDHCFLRPHR